MGRCRSCSRIDHCGDHHPQPQALDAGFARLLPTVPMSDIVFMASSSAPPPLQVPSLKPLEKSLEKRVINVRKLPTPASKGTKTTGKRRQSGGDGAGSSPASKKSLGKKLCHSLSISRKLYYWRNCAIGLGGD